MRRTSQGKDFDFILMVKMETRHPVEGYFGSEFCAICNHCGAMAAWSRNTWKYCEQIFAFFFEKTTPSLKFSKLCFKRFHRLTYRRCCVQISWNVADVKSVKSWVIYLTKTITKTKFLLPLKLSLRRYCADRAQNLPGPAPNKFSQC